MAVPTFVSMSPSTGSPTGGQLVEIVGTGFRLAGPPPATGPVPARVSPVRVSFGGVASTRVAVVSDTRLFAVTPRVLMPVVGGATQGVFVAPVEITNVDDTGAPIAGETVVVPSSYTYARPDVSTSTESPLTSLIRALIRRLKSEVLQDVVIAVHTDYDGDPTTPHVEQATVPSLVLTGPTLVKNTFYTDNASDSITLGPNEVSTQRRAIFFDVDFDIVVIAQSEMQLLNLIDLITVVIDRSSSFVLQCPPPVGAVQLDLEWRSGMRASVQSNQLNSNIRSARGSIGFNGVPFASIAGVERDAVIDVSALVTSGVVTNTQRIDH